MLYEIIVCEYEPEEEHFFVDLSDKEIKVIKTEISGQLNSQYTIKVDGGKREIEVGIIDSIRKCVIQPASKNAITKKGEKFNAEIEIEQYIDEYHITHYWYGGDTAHIKYKGYIFHISAIGDICATLLSENNEELVYVKDKNNGGSFYCEMHNFIENDETIIKKTNNGNLVFENNNWWEISATDPEGVWHDLFWCADGYSLSDAVDECLENMEKYILGVI